MVVIFRRELSTTELIIFTWFAPYILIEEEHTERENVTTKQENRKNSAQMTLDSNTPPLLETIKDAKEDQPRREQKE